MVPAIQDVCALLKYIWEKVKRVVSLLKTEPQVIS
jgi:hypothetical protein